MSPKRPQTIIEIADNKLTACKISFRNNKTVIDKSLEYDFTASNLSAALTKLRHKFGINSARVLLPPNNSYLKLLEIPIINGINREVVIAEAQKEIPEKIEEGYFDWKMHKVEHEVAKIQILGASKDYLSPIIEAANKIGLNLEAFEHQAFALSRLTKNYEEPHIIADSGQKMVLAAFHGQVYEQLKVDDMALWEQKISDTINLVREKWGMEIKKVIREDLDPRVGLFLKDDLLGNDENTLNLNPASNPAPKKNSHSNKALFWGVLTGTVMIVVISAMLIKSAPDKAKTITPELRPSPTVMIKSTPSPSPVLKQKNLKKEDLKLEILNGSGISGKAGEAKQFLENLGYKNIEIGNADSAGYAKTEISIKDAKAAYLPILLKDLKDNYTVSAKAGSLEETSQYDAVIIIGQK